MQKFGIPLILPHTHDGMYSITPHTHIYTVHTNKYTPHTQITVLRLLYIKCFTLKRCRLLDVCMLVFTKDGLVIVGFQSNFLLFKLFHSAWNQALNRSIFIIADEWAPLSERKSTGLKQVFAHFLFLGLAHKGLVSLHIF